jgi:prophage maintenance system killer protein
VIALEVADLVIIASRTLSLDSSQVLDLLDPTAAEHALAQARPGSEPGDPASLAAALLHALVRQQPLRHGNKQVALAAMLQFLALNGWDVDPEPPGPIAAVIADIAAGTLTTRDLADWLAPRLRPSDRAGARPGGRAGARMKETPMLGRPALPLAERIRRATMRKQPTGMFQRFTDRARRAGHLAQDEARLLRHDYVGPEHLLLSLLYEEEGVAAKALASLGISREDVRFQVEEIIGHGQSSGAGPIAFTAAARTAMELSLREALALGHHYIGTEHLLLGLLREGEGEGQGQGEGEGEGQGIAAQVLTRLGTDHARVRERVLDLLADGCAQADPLDLADVAEELTEVRRQKQAAFDAGDLDGAAALHDRERQLLADKLRLEQQLTAGRGGQAIIAENQRLHRELDRLRQLLRRHGIEPDGGTARTA